MEEAVAACPPLSTGTQIRVYREDEVPVPQRFYTYVTGIHLRQPERVKKHLLKRLEVTDSEVLLCGKGRERPWRGPEKCRTYFYQLSSKAVAKLAEQDNIIMAGMRKLKFYKVEHNLERWKKQRDAARAAARTAQATEQESTQESSESSTFSGFQEGSQPEEEDAGA